MKILRSQRSYNLTNLMKSCQGRNILKVQYTNKTRITYFQSTLFDITEHTFK